VPCQGTGVGSISDTSLQFKSIDYGQVIMNSNQRKDVMLGMPHGTANNRLRKNILFHLLKKHGENICNRCSKPIVLVEELSVEHIKPWEGVDAQLFWDIDNIAFSHLRCNVSSHRTPNKIYAPEGKSWCSMCKDFKSRTEFHQSTATVSGLQRQCKQHRSEMRSSGAWLNGAAAKSECRT
jgi:hypothetical protein